MLRIRTEDSTLTSAIQEQWRIHLAKTNVYILFEYLQFAVAAERCVDATSATQAEGTAISLPQRGEGHPRPLKVGARDIAAQRHSV